jgi:hypothetical protein
VIAVASGGVALARHGQAIIGIAGGEFNVSMYDYDVEIALLSGVAQAGEVNDDSCEFMGQLVFRLFGNEYIPYNQSWCPILHLPEPTATCEAGNFLSFFSVSHIRIQSIHSRLQIPRHGDLCNNLYFLLFTFQCCPSSASPLK